MDIKLHCKCSFAIARDGSRKAALLPNAARSKLPALDQNPQQFLRARHRRALPLRSPVIMVAVDHGDRILRAGNPVQSCENAGRRRGRIYESGRSQDGSPNQRGAAAITLALPDGQFGYPAFRPYRSPFRSAPAGSFTSTAVTSGRRPAVTRLSAARPFGSPSRPVSFRPSPAAF